MSKKEDVEIQLGLGDIIKITNEKNENLNEKTFIIDYIDESKVILINIDTLKIIKISIDENGIIGDGNITQLEILSKADTPSYSKQHGLVTGTWINIHFGGNYPAIITGLITNVEEDMIEIQTSPDKQTIYINFDYKGIPEDLPIDRIDIRDKPSEPIKQLEEGEEENNEYKEEGEEENDEDEEDDDEPKSKRVIPSLSKSERQTQMVDSKKIQVMVNTSDVKNKIREIYLKADQIVFGDEELGRITQFEDVSLKLQRYSIETQVSDLLDDLLSTIPSAKRTSSVLNNIHQMIDRFKQLRDNFSTYDKYNNVDGPLVKEAKYKPLKNWLQSFNTNLYWILPVVKNIKKVYDIEYAEEANNDLQYLELKFDLRSIKEIIDKYKTNELSGDSDKYSIFYSELSPYFIPFNEINEEDTGILIKKECECNIHVLIDNLEDLYSSVFNNNKIRNKRFVISRYNLGETKLDITELTSSRMKTIRVKLTNNDVMHIKSIMTLPEPTIRFSKINLPGTNILTRANLNQVFLNYWKLLKNNTTVNDVVVDSSVDELDFDENVFASGIKNYIINMPSEETTGMTKNVLYSKYTNSIIPKTRVLFNLMKKYINGKLSIVDVVSYLEPFLIYTDDLTFKQYEDITKFINTQISEYNKNMIEYSKIFNNLLKIQNKPLIFNSIAFTIVDIIKKQNRTDIFEDGYNMGNPEETFSNSEILRKLLLKDCSKLYTSGLAYENVNLQFSKDMIEIFSEEKKGNETNLKDEVAADKCSNIVIAKMYSSLAQLEKDNDTYVFFDKKYDKTNYGIMEELDGKKGYATAVLNLSPENLKKYIAEDQMKKNKLSLEDANYLADTLIDGNKMVIDGQYAILYKGYSPNIEDEFDYYIRKNNKWELDKKLSVRTGIFDEPSSVLCNLQEKCIQVESASSSKCESIKTDKFQLKNSLLNNIISEFDTKYKLSNEEYNKEIKEHYDYLRSIMPFITKIETSKLLKNNNEKYNIGISLDNEGDENIHGISPFLNLLKIILGQKDFVKKQEDIIRFVNKFTRPAIIDNYVNGKLESEHWLYCVKTHERLLPAFKKELALSFITSQDKYLRTLESIKTNIGQLSDDGDWWTDKYTGWPICPGEFDVEEGYNEGGFKILTRSIMEEDAGNKIVYSTAAETRIKYITPETVMINNIINALSVAIGINIETQKEFIINAVTDTIKNTVESESDYNDKIKSATQKGKSIMSYKDFFNASLLYYTLGMYLIAIQTSIPSIKTRKTHPGCVRSFKGYPFDGSGDLSSLTYLSCVTYDIRSPTEPWNVIKKTKVEAIQTKIKTVIDNYLLSLSSVQRKFLEKTTYLLESPPTEIPEEHDISKWTDFLPPLVPFKIKHLVNVSEEFKESLVKGLINGDISQREKILVLESKITQFSLAIQEKIQNIIKSKHVLLHTANNEPYVENACCETSENEAFIDYFIAQDMDIDTFNKNVKKISNMLDDIKSNTEPVIFLSELNTKTIYPDILTNFDEKTIYLTFIYYCKFKSLIPIPQHLLPYCTEKPDAKLIHITDTIDRMIQKLKEDGRNYTLEQFLRFVQIISRENIVNVDLINPVVSCVTTLSHIIKSIYDNKKVNLHHDDKTFLELMQKSIETFDTEKSGMTQEVKELNNFLIKKNDFMIAEIKDFVSTNRGKINRKTFVNFITALDNLSVWSLDKSSEQLQSNTSFDTACAVSNFYKTFIDNFVNIFPNKILNKVADVKINIPDYYKFSNNHKNKLNKIITEYFENLKLLYGDAIITNILTKIQESGKYTVLLSKTTPSFSSINLNGKRVKGVIDEKTSRRLFEYYFLRILYEYIELTDNPDMLVTEKTKDVDIADIFTSESVEEIDTFVDISVSLHKQQMSSVVSGNKSILKKKISELLIIFMEIFSKEKDIVDTTYEDITDRVFKLREREKDLVTDRLKAMTDEERTVDTVFKITKQGLYSKGMQKGFSMYDKKFYDDEGEQNLRDNMERAERQIKKKNKDATDRIMDILAYEYLEQVNVDDAIDEDAYDMSGLHDDYDDGNFDGNDAPEEYDDYND